MKKGWTGVSLVFFVLFLVLAGQDKSKKVYELIYEDIQVLKKQLIAVEEKQNRDAAEIRLLKEQLRELQNQVRALQRDHAGLQEGIKSIPSHYQFLLDKIDQMNFVLARISEDLLVLKGAPAQPSTPVPVPAGEQPVPGEKKAPDQKKETPAAGPKPAGPPLALSPQDLYNTAYADYLQGNFDLAIDGFKIYRDNFPESPLADNALYWIGECYFSQRNFEAA
ncbi:MAG: tetratricopeptide repeat protein, partial [Candidatus Aminicenantes bacterium]|nr:tetratricopeptide repeat protein [Candidatus Aminicenantes bacterium]